MKFEIVTENNDIVLSPYDRGSLYRILSFKTQGNYVNTGRTCYYTLAKPVKCNGVIFRSLKIKGCGYRDLSDNSFVLPGSSVFNRTEGHIGFDANANTVIVFSDEAPLGGLIFERAKQEYDNFSTLINNNVSALTPFLLIKYKDLIFCEKHLGANVSLCYDIEPYRMNKLLYDNKYINSSEFSYFQKILLSEGIVGNILEIDTRLKLCLRIAEKYAQEMYKFSNSNLYIHSGGWSNIQYSIDNQNVVLIDLDSTRNLNAISDKRIQKLYKIRDFISNIYRLLISLYNPKVISNINADVLNRNNLIFALLKGYFQQPDKLDYLYTISIKILRFYFETCFLKIKTIEIEMNGIPINQRRKYELNMKLFYDFCIKLLMPLC